MKEAYETADDRAIPAAGARPACTLRQALVIVLAGAALGLAANAVSPRGIPLLTPPKAPPRAKDVVTLDEAKALWSSGTAFFLDARATSDYKAGHIAGALSLPIDEFDDYYPQIQSVLTTDSVIVCYCDGLDCDLSHRLVDRLRELHYRNVRLLVNGWTTWHTAGLLTHSGTDP
ncbi:MAG TPA: rhodanese-like domain-containing protein [Verrucomicrobiae bacterium]|nr:rhodanese-like domain-containing protein [Verrucomicrobiae bacterium]